MIKLRVLRFGNYHELFRLTQCDYDSIFLGQRRVHVIAKEVRVTQEETKMIIRSSQDRDNKSQLIVTKFK